MKSHSGRSLVSFLSKGIVGRFKPRSFSGHSPQRMQSLVLLADLRFPQLQRFALAAIYMALFSCAATAPAQPAQTLTNLANFAGPNGVNPSAGLVQGTDGNFYGTTFQGGANHGYQGTVFVMAPDGTLTTLHSFVGSDGSFPYAPLVQGTDGNFYGTTQNGGASLNCHLGCGTVFMMTPNGTLTTLHSFSLTDGATPTAALVQGTDENFYGTTVYGGGGSNCAIFTPTGCGTIFKITPAGSLTTLHVFNLVDGYEPFAGLAQAPNGNFYGTTAEGVMTGHICAYGCGTIFQITPAGVLTTLHIFQGLDGSFPRSPLLLATDGNVYGTTSGGGSSTNCSIGCGTIFKITPAGTFIVMHSFDLTDGSDITAGLLQATDGNFYGATPLGGTSAACGTVGCGTVFRITTAATLTTLHNFCPQANCADGSDPNALLQAANGAFYSTTFGGGAFNAGTVFSLSVGSLQFKPAAARGGQMAIGTLTLAGPAPSGGVTLVLTSSQPRIVHVPEAVYFHAGQITARFAARTVPARRQSVTVSAVGGNASISGTITVLP